MKYLYGASIQGIQSFIFQTNELRDIVGASEMVEQISTKEFSTFCKEMQLPNIPDLEKDSNYIIKAAGNIKYLFDDKDSCEKVVMHFPKHIANLVPGITISQAVVPVEGSLKEAIDELEKRLKAQRSKVSMPIETGLMGLNRDRRTGGVAFETNSKPGNDGGSEYICEATSKKRVASREVYRPERENQSPNLFSKISGTTKISEGKIPFMMEEITSIPDKSWLAIIHADGNGLGMLLQKLGESLKTDVTNDDVKNAFSTFSQELDTATREAAQYAFEKVIASDEELMQKINDGKVRYPLRPVLLGGDDLTLIIRADLAIDFTIEFLKAFELRTAERFKFLKEIYKVNGFENGLTACAGIAFIKESYPFHYGVHLAEKLTSKAKKFSKKDKEAIPPSSLSFYKVQSSFVESLEDITHKTLTAHASRVSFDYGPYLLHSSGSLPSIPDLKQKLALMEKLVGKDGESKGISKLRKWVSELYRDEATADFMLKRIKQIDKNENLTKLLESTKFEAIELPEDITDDTKYPSRKTMIYDLLQLHSLKY